MVRINKIGVYTGIEKRKFQRLNLPLKVRYRIIGQRGAEGDARCINVSGGGIRICVSDRLEMDDRLEVAIYAPTVVKPIVAVGRVVWSGKIDGQFEGGLEFIKMTFRKEFTMYLCEQMLNLSFKKGETNGG